MKIERENKKRHFVWGLLYLSTCATFLPVAWSGNIVSVNLLNNFKLTNTSTIIFGFKHIKYFIFTLDHHDQPYHQDYLCHLIHSNVDLSYRSLKE
jgi:hypothetical protein